MSSRILSLLLVLCGLPVLAAAAPPTPVSPMTAALVTEATGRLDDALAAVQRSAQALGATYLELSRTTPPPRPETRARWLQNHTVKEGTVAFRDPAATCGPNPRAQADCPSLLYYDGENFTDETFRQLDLMSRLAPAMAAAHGALPYSWVYLTTPNQNFCIYPYLPLDDALSNYKPTEKLFYTIADFKNKACGWESPYLDLAGAGMMVTVSCPVYDGDTLLGVASRDVTLAQLSKRVMTDLAAIPGARAALMNRRGKAIAASDPRVADFIVRTNTKARDAVVYFRADRGLAALGQEKGVDSPDDTLNAACETVIEQAETSKVRPIVFTQGEDQVLAGRLDTTGWYLVLLVPLKAAK